MYFKTNNSISLTLLTQTIDDTFTALGLALLHDIDQGTKKNGTRIAQNRLVTAVVNGSQEGNWGAGSFTMLTEYVRPLVNCLKDFGKYGLNTYNQPKTNKKLRVMHKALFRNPFEFLYKHLDYPKSKVPEPNTDNNMLCASCGTCQNIEGEWDCILSDRGSNEVVSKFEREYRVKIPKASPLCSTCFTKIPWIEATENIAKRLAVNIKPPTNATIIVDPNTKIVGCTSHKIGDKYSVCVVFETDRGPFEYVKDKEYLSTQIVMATGEPLPY